MRRIQRVIQGIKYLWLDFEGSSDRNESQDFFDLGVGEGDAAVCPVVIVLERTEIFVFFSTPWIIMSPPGGTPWAMAWALSAVWVRDMKSEVVAALQVLRVDGVFAFRGFVSP